MPQKSAHIPQFLKKLAAWLPGDVKVMAAFSFSGVIGSLIGIVAGPLILQKVGLAQFGFLGLALFVHSLFNTIADFGIPAHLISVSSRPEGRQPGEIGNAFALKLALLGGVGVLFLGYLLGYPHPREAKALVGAYLSALVFSASHIEWFYISGRRYRELILGRLLAAGSMAVLIAWWYFFGRGLWFIPVGTALAQFAELAYLGGRIVAKQGWPHWEPISWPRMGAILLKVAPMAGTQILSPFFLASGIFLMQKNLAPAEWVGAYNVSQRIIIGWLALTGPLILFLIPKLAGRSGRARPGRMLGLSAALSACFLAAGMVLIGIFYLVSGNHGDFLRFSLETYAILMLGIFLNLARLQAVSMMIVHGLYGRYFLIHLLGGLPNIALAFVPGLGVPLAAVPWLACLPELIVTVLVLALPGSKARVGPREE